MDDGSDLEEPATLPVIGQIFVFLAIGVAVLTVCLGFSGKITQRIDFTKANLATGSSNAAGTLE